MSNFLPVEKVTYEDSLKYYRDLNNVVDTSRQEGRKEGREEGASRIVVRQLEKRFGQLPASVFSNIRSLDIDGSESLGEALMDFGNLDDLEVWLERCAGD